jgi:hypothetical protein
MGHEHSETECSTVTREHIEAVNELAKAMRIQL